MSTTPSKCTYIINRNNKDKQRVCGTRSSSGPLCAKHSKMGTPRKGAKNWDDDDDDDDEGSSFLSTASYPLTSRSRQATPCEKSPSRPSTARTGTPSRKLGNSNSADVDDAPRTTRSGTPIRSSISAATSPQPSTPRRGPPRLSKGSSFTSTSTLESASGYSLRSAALEPTSTPPSSTGDDDIEGLTHQLNDLAVEDDSDNDIDSAEETESDTVPSLPEWPKIPQRTNTGDTQVSHGPPEEERRLGKYIPEGVHTFLHGDLIKELREPPARYARGYVYMLFVTPLEYPTSKIIIKIGCANEPKTRLSGLRNQCKFHIYEPLELYHNKIEETALQFKVERLVHETLQHRKLHPPKPCPCNSVHRELFWAEDGKELKSMYSRIKHWTKVVNEHHNELWPGALERLILKAKREQEARQAADAK